MGISPVNIGRREKRSGELQCGRERSHEEIEWKHLSTKPFSQ
jgi:hypothetical protein